jgi:hypothetical protein
VPLPEHFSVAHAILEDRPRVALVIGNITLWLLPTEAESLAKELADHAAIARTIPLP